MRFIGYLTFLYLSVQRNSFYLDCFYCNSYTQLKISKNTPKFQLMMLQRKNARIALHFRRLCMLHVAYKNTFMITISFITLIVNIFVFALVITTFLVTVRVVSKRKAHPIFASVLDNQVSKYMTVRSF